MREERRVRWTGREIGDGWRVRPNKKSTLAGWARARQKAEWRVRMTPSLSTLHLQGQR